MLSSQPDPKDLPRWMELDYFRRPRSLTYWRKVIVRASLVGSLLLGGFFVLFSFTWLPQTKAVYQAGPVAPVHAMFNHDCGQCHTEALRTARRLWHLDDKLRSVSDTACLKCHDGPLHQEQQLETPNCATCHKEHHGQPLTLVADRHCLACHADLQTRGGACRFQRRITAFATDHPEFGQWQGKPKDPGTIRFNHQAHLQSEGILVRGNERRQLTCSDCHQADDAGRYMRPINYEQHCAACHPLAVQVAGNGGDDKLRMALEGFRNQPAPHREPAIVRAVLRDRLTEFVQQWPRVLDNQAGEEHERPLPGGQPTRTVTREQWEWVGQQLERTEEVLFDKAGGCRYCHQVKDNTNAKKLPLYALSAIPKRWYPHSRFSHVAHRLLQCTACHEQTARSTATSDVLMPGVQTCRQCHSPRGGARFDCVECHLYHDRARERGLNGPLTIEACTGRPGTP